MSTLDSRPTVFYGDRIARLGVALTKMSRELVASRREVARLKREVARLEAELAARPPAPRS